MAFPKQFCREGERVQFAGADYSPALQSNMQDATTNLKDALMHQMQAAACCIVAASPGQDHRWSRSDHSRF